MAKIIDLPDGTEVEFPDSMGDDEIKAVLRKKFPVAEKPAATKYGLTKEPGVVEQFVGGAKHAWDKAAAALESAVPGGRALSKTLKQPDLQQLVESGKQFVAETGPASTVGELAGEVALTAAPGTKAYQAAQAVARRSPILARTLGLVGGGAAAGAAGSATMGEDIGEGALAGAAFAPAVAGVQRLGGALANTFGGATGRAASELREVFGDRTQAAIAALRGLRGNVLGEAPTAGRAASASLPELKVLEEAARRRPGANRLLEIDESNALARQAAIEPIADVGRRYPGAGPSEAEQFRQSVTRPLYARAAENRVQLTPDIQDLVQGAEAQGAVRRARQGFSQAQTNAAVAGRPVPTGAVPGNMPVRGTRELRDPDTGMPLGAVRNEPFMPDYGSRSVADLQQVKQYLDAEIRGLGRSGSDDNRMRRLMESRSQLNALMKEQSGNYRLADEMFANLSAPQNQAEVANVLAKALRQSPGQFLAATEDAARTIKRADLSPRYEHLQDVMTPDQMGIINALRRSAQREVDYAGLPVSQEIVPKYMSVFDKLENVTPGVFNQAVTVIRAGLKRLGGRSDEQVRRVIDEAVTDPNRFADLLEVLPVTERNRVISGLLGQETVGATSAAVGANVGGNQ